MKHIRIKTDCTNIILSANNHKKTIDKLTTLVYHIKDNNNLNMYPITGTYLKIKGGYGLLLYTLHTTRISVFECKIVKNKIDIIQNSLNVNTIFFGGLWNR